MLRSMPLALWGPESNNPNAFRNPRPLEISPHHSFRAPILCLTGDSKQETGVFAEEIASPYYVFKNAGFDVKIASIAGGKIPLGKRTPAQLSSARDHELL